MLLQDSMQGKRQSPWAFDFFAWVYIFKSRFRSIQDRIHSHFEDFNPHSTASFTPSTIIFGVHAGSPPA